MNSFHVFFFYLVRVRTGFVCVCVCVCVCAMCFAPTQSVSRWKAGLPSGLISSPQTVDCDSFRRLLIWHIWSPSMWQWMLTPADSTLLHFQLIAASVAPLWKDFHLSQTCVCVCSKAPTGWVLSPRAALTEQNYCPVWSHIQNHSGNIQYAELTGGGSPMNCAVASVGLDLARQTSFINWFIGVICDYWLSVEFIVQKTVAASSQLV